MEARSVAERDTAILAALTRQVSLRTICAVYAIDALTVRQVAERAGQTLPVDAPGPHIIYSQRDAEIIRRALGGEDFTVIGDSLGITREWVRVIVKNNTGLSAKDLAGARESARRLFREQMVRDIAATDSDASLTDLANRSGLNVREVQTLLGAAEAARRRQSRTIANAASKEQIIASLQRVAAFPGGTPLSGPFYDKHCGDSVKSQRIIQVFDTWSAACAAAEVRSIAPVRADYQQQWTREDCLQWVAAYAGTTANPTFHGLTAWLRTQPGAPSSGTVRLRCGGWIKTLRDAHALPLDGSGIESNGPGERGATDESSDDPPDPTPARLPTMPDSSSGQGYQTDVERRSVVENAAQDRLVTFFEDRGWQVEDTRTTQPFDAIATKGGLIFYLEAKGTESAGDSVMITRGEVEHAHVHPGQCVIGIWSNMQFDDDSGALLPNAGDFRVLWFEPDVNDLKVVTYLWTPPADTAPLRD